MKKAPCNRLGMRIRPKISEKPDDSRNRSPPRARLLIARIAACADVICVIIGWRVSSQTGSKLTPTWRMDTDMAHVWKDGPATGTAGLPLPIGAIGERVGVRGNKPLDRNPLTPTLSPAGRGSRP